MHYLGLDIGGTKIAAVVMDAHGWEIRRYRCPTQKSTYQQFVSCVVALIEQIRRDVQRPMLTGIALPGSISPLTGLIKNANIQVINGHALQADLQQLLGQPVVTVSRYQKLATVPGKIMTWYLVLRLVRAVAVALPSSSDRL